MIVETEWLAIFLLPPKPQRTRRQKILLTALRASLRFRYCYQDTRRVGFRSIRLAWKGKEHKRPEGAPSQSDPYERNPPGNNISRNRERCRKLSLWKRRVFCIIPVADARFHKATTSLARWARFRVLEVRPKGVRERKLFLRNYRSFQ